MNTPARAGLSNRMKECFDTIKVYIERNGCSPSYTDLMKALDLRSKSSAYRLVVELRDRGWVTFMEYMPRSIAIVPDLNAPNGYVLPTKVQSALLRHCAATNEDPSAVVADAVALMLDDAEGKVAA